MKKDTFEWEIYIERKPELILAFLSDYDRHTLIHPLIIAVKAVPAPAGVLKRYLITDQLQWGIFRFKIQYRADILRITDEEIYTTAFQSPGTTVENLTRVSPEGSGARLKETVTLSAPDLLFNYAFSQAKAAHQGMLARIKHTLENGEPG